MTRGQKPPYFPKALRHQALVLAEKHLTGSQRKEAVAWLKNPYRTEFQVIKFIERMNAKNEEV